MAGEPHHGPPRRPGAPPRRFSRLERDRGEQAERERASRGRGHEEHPSDPARAGSSAWTARAANVSRPVSSGSGEEGTESRQRHPGLGLALLRYALPGVVVLAGVIAMSFGTTNAVEGGAGLVSAGLAIWFLNWLFRVGARGDEERDVEDRARDYFDRHGRWPEGR